MNTYTKWEYKEVSNFAKLNELGNEGWELCAAHNGFYVFKRPIVEQKLQIENVEKAVEILDSIKKAKKKLATPQFKVGDWVIHKNKAWGWSYEVAKIKNGKAFLWVNKDILDMPYDIANLVICDNFEKYPKHDGKPIKNKAAKKINPKNPQDIRKGNWVCVGKESPRCFKVLSVMNGKVVLLYNSKPFLDIMYSFKDIYKPSAEELKFKTKIF